MPASPVDYLAIDLGAESGRALLGAFDGQELTLKEIHRFANNPVKIQQTLHWNLPQLWTEIQRGIQQAVAVNARLDGVGVDTWGVDFGLIGRGDTLLGNPVHYRDQRTSGMIEAAARRCPRDRIYEITGLQFLPFNTVYQLLALKTADSPLLESAESLLMMPDLFGWLLTGNKVAEYTDASTTQLLDASRRAWSEPLCQSLLLPRSILPDIVNPGTSLGPLSSFLADDLRVPRVPVLSVAGHDTASAVAAVPAIGHASMRPDWCYLSSGTWSLLGVEVPNPVINKASFAYNFTNEGGVKGTIRLLKNIMGLWLVQECRRAWARDGIELDYETLTQQAAAAPPFAALVDPDHADFLAPGDMPARLASFCRRTGQKPPESPGAIVRMCLESLALRYRWTIQRLEEMLDCSIQTIHVVGGGSKNALLNQFTADACGRTVLAGPVEATAIGNCLLQAMGRGRLGSLAELRLVVARSFPVQRFEPADPDRWLEAAGRWEALISRTE